MARLSLMLAAPLLLAGTAQAHEIIHADHTHRHAVDCGHPVIEHEGHVDYLHDGHMHEVHGDHVDEHRIAVTSTNPTAEKLIKPITHGDHSHGGVDHAHPTVQHGDHFDFIHAGKLHHPHGDHLDDHGPVTVIS